MKTNLSFLFCLLFSICAFSKKEKPIFRKVSDKWASIPAGTLVTFDAKAFYIPSFWMQKTEVTNGEYLEFVDAVRISGDENKLKKILPDTNSWNYSTLFSNEKYVKNYFRHTYYRDYPVVGISYESALLYCEWLTEKYNKKLHELFPRLLANKIIVTLPHVNQWMWAAKGGYQEFVYPWPGTSLMNTNGCYLANYRKMGDDQISYGSEGNAEIKPPLKTSMPISATVLKNSYYELTKAVNSFNPNYYGLYNIAGNVAEMTSNSSIRKGGSWFTYGYDARIEAPDPFEGDLSAKPYIGFRPIFIVNN